MSAQPKPTPDDFWEGFGEWLEEQRLAFWAAGGPTPEEEARMSGEGETR